MTPSKPLTIAFLLATPGTTWGGMERHTADLAGALASMGHKVHVLGHQVYQNRFPAGITYHPLPVQLGRRNLWLQLALRRRLRELSPDVLHAQGNKAAQLAGKAGRLVRVCVGTVHGTKSSHKAFDRLDHVIAVSPRIMSALRHPRKHLIYNGVDIEPIGGLADNDAGLPPGVTNIIAVGRLEPVKGFDTLISAWAMLDKSAENCHLTIFGEGSQRAQLERLIRGSGLEHAVSLPGYCQNLAPVYGKAGLTVISSEREGFPYVLVESLVHGCPVISTPVSGPRDILPPDSMSTGYQARDLAGVMARALADLEALKHSQQSVMAFAQETMTIRAMAEQTEALYLKALSENPSRKK